MTTTLSLTEAQTFVALQSFLISIMPAGMEIVKGQENLVAEPDGADFIEMTPVFRERLSTNITNYQDGWPSAPMSRSDMVPTKVTIQLDVHGPASADNTHIITTLFRSDFATDMFAQYGYDVTPLYHEDPKQIPFLNAEQQVESRWVLDLVMQCNPVVTVSQDFAAALALNLISVDAVYPPS